MARAAPEAAPAYLVRVVVDPACLGQAAAVQACLAREDRAAPARVAGVGGLVALAVRAAPAVAGLPDRATRVVADPVVPAARAVHADPAARAARVADLLDRVTRVVADPVAPVARVVLVDPAARVVPGVAAPEGLAPAIPVRVDLVAVVAAVPVGPAWQVAVVVRDCQAQAARVGPASPASAATRKRSLKRNSGSLLSSKRM